LQFERDRNKLELWPLFSYATDPASQAKRLRLLLTVVQYQSTATSYDLKVLLRLTVITFLRALLTSVTSFWCLAPTRYCGV
jgi:hypothetical protein